jgi:large subunit ribosomal protein L22
MFGYSYSPENEEKAAKAYGRELRVSYKYAVEMCRELRGKKLEKAKEYLEEIMEMKRALPLRRFKKGVAHRHGLKRAYAGRYPIKVAEHLLKLLRSAEANAEYNGLDVDRLYITHISAAKGRLIKRYFPRAFGRATPHNKHSTNLQVVLEER